MMHLGKKKRWLLLIFPLLAVGIFLFFAGRTPSYPAGKESERLTFLAHFGWETAGQPPEVKTVQIPEVFDAVYQNYNTIQLAQGFDLRDYAGKEVELCQYIVTNYPNYPSGIRANLLISDDKVIGGDICSIALGGFMHGFSYESCEIGRNSEKSAY